MNKLVATLALTAVCAGPFCQRFSGQQTTHLTTAELLRILRISTFRIRVSQHKGDVWDIKMLRKDDLKPQSINPQGLTKSKWLLSMLDTGAGKYEFTLPELDRAFSQGIFEICKEISCEGIYSVKWFKQPLYSADGTQCILGEFSNLDDVKPSAYIALVRARSFPE
jgi:hypothetical protein